MTIVDYLFLPCRFGKTSSYLVAAEPKSAPSTTFPPVRRIAVVPFAICPWILLSLLTLFGLTGSEVFVSCPFPLSG